MHLVLRLWPNMQQLIFLYGAKVYRDTGQFSKSNPNDPRLMSFNTIVGTVPILSADIVFLLQYLCVDIDVFVAAVSLHLLVDN